jgi:DNA-binding transcriptional MocR family regulator
MAVLATERLQALLSDRAQRGGRPNQGADGPRFNFGGGKPDPASFPYQELAQAMADVMETDGADALTYGQLYGYRGLRELVARKYKVFEGLEISPDQILITNGSNDAIAQSFQAFVSEGDPVITEAPTFVSSIQSLRRIGADVHGIEVDDEGMRMDLVAAKLAELKAAGRPCKVIYTINNFQNPSGPTMSEARRHELLRLAEEYGCIIVEDDAYGELRYDGEPLPSLLSLDTAGLVCRTGTLSKILGAGFRLGWIAASDPAVLPYCAAFNFGGGVSPLTSRIASFYLENHLESHVAELVDIYREKRDAMLDELEKGLAGTDATFSRPEGGFFIWIKLPTSCDLDKLAKYNAEVSVGVVSGTSFMPNGGGERFIRLAFSFESPELIREGTRLLCESIRKASA